jgi:Cu(I)/Ag(I) efflux system protein CusF
MKTFLISVITASTVGLVAIPIYANDAHHPKAELETQQSYAATGEVVAIDKDASKVKLRHEAISELGWPAMTMNFAVTDKSQLDELQAGDKVNFEIVKDQSTGQYVITTMQLVK